MPVAGLSLDLEQVSGCCSEQPAAVRRRRGHQRAGAGMCSGAVLLGAIQPPAMTGSGGYQSGAGRLGGPTPSGSRLAQAGPASSLDGDGFEVSFAAGPVLRSAWRGSAEDRPALTGPATTRQRQAQPARPDRVGKGRGSGSARPRTGAFITKRTSRGERPTGTYHSHPLESCLRCPPPDRANIRCHPGLQSFPSPLPITWPCCTRSGPPRPASSPTTRTCLLAAPPPGHDPGQPACAW